MKPKMFQLAQKISQKSPSKFKLGCIIAKRNKVVTVGFNDMAKSHPKTLDPWKTIHAEFHALIGLSESDTKGCVAYVYRETKDGKPANAKPCDTCQTALKLAGIKKVYYTVPLEPFYAEIDLRYT